MFTSDAPRPMALLAVSIPGKLPASVGVPRMMPLVLLNESPGGNPLAVKFSGVFAAVTAKLKGWFKNATALNALVMTAGALELPLMLFVGYSRLLGMICFDWLGLYQLRCTSAAPLSCMYSSLMS